MRYKIQLTLVSLLLMVGASAQQWSPPGATWTYSYSNQFATIGYVEIKYIGDSIVEGQPTNVLEKTRYTFDQFNAVYDTVIIGKEFTYLDSNIIYYYRYGEFFTLYDFNSQANSTWEVAGNDAGIGACDSTAIVKVDSVSTTSINSTSLKLLHMAPPDSVNWQVGSTIAERIGSIDAYMFPESYLCMLDNNEGGAFRCYWDDSFALYSSGSATSCDFITSIESIPDNLRLELYPNPTSGILTLVNLPREATGVYIYNYLGELVFVEELSRFGEPTIDLASLTTGVYFFHVTQGTTTFQKRIIKI